VTGADWAELAESTQKIMDRMRESGMTTDENSNYVIGLPEVRIVPDRQRAADLGVSMATIGNTISSTIGGVRAAKFKDGARRFDVRVRLMQPERAAPEDVGKLFVRGRDGRLVQMSEIVRLREQPTVQSITRRNRQRAITITANVAGGKSQKDVLAHCLAIARETLPAGCGVELAGSSRLFEEAGRELMLALALGILIAYMVLASQFNSFVHPALVLLAMPFSITGAILGLMLVGASINMYSMIGVVLLMGIVKKNSILLVEFTNHVRGQGKGVREALLEACPVRLRPILMTSVSTVAAALPPALALGPGAEARMPMAMVVIGGVILSTFLTLYVVPCAYSLVPGRVKSSKDIDDELAGEPAKELAAMHE
jgi:HAE1 family hydrophobic/amphiphilic exporter-1